MSFTQPHSPSAANQQPLYTDSYQLNSTYYRAGWLTFSSLLLLYAVTDIPLAGIVCSLTKCGTARG